MSTIYYYLGHMPKRKTKKEKQAVRDRKLELISYSLDEPAPQSAAIAKRVARKTKRATKKLVAQDHTSAIIKDLRRSVLMSGLIIAIEVGIYIILRHPSMLQTLLG